MSDIHFIKQFFPFSQNIRLGKNIFVFDELPSTNRKAKELMRKGAEEGTVIIAQRQTKGRGRFQRKWVSPEGGVYFSVILRPPDTDKTTLLSLIAALAVAKTINTLYQCPARIKWPNDVRIRGKKIAGVLVESEVNEKKGCYVVLGVGVNVNTDINQFPREIQDVATSLSQELQKTIEFQQFLEQLLAALDAYYTFFLNKDFDKILQEWRTWSDTLGRRVKIATSSEDIVGNAQEVDQNGFLLVVTDSGHEKRITDGDCIYLRDT